MCVLAASDTLCRLHGCAPVVVAAGHYPLSVVVHPDTARYDRLPAQNGAHNHLPTRQACAGHYGRW
jgi:hypothetical protein